MRDPYSKYSRRDFIRDFGLAAGLAVPFLRSSVAMGQTTVAPTRLLLIPLQHGWNYDKDVSRFTGSEFNFALARPFEALEPIRNQCVFVDGVRSGYWGNAHDVSYSDIFTCGVRYEQPNNGALGGPFPNPSSPSIDWLIGNHFSKGVLRFCAGFTSWGAAHHPCSFDSSLRNLPYFTNARDAYMSIIDPLRQQQQNLGSNLTSAQGNALLGALGRDADRLLRRLQGAERTKMEGYISSLNALGSRILGAGGTDLSNIVLPNLPGMNLQINETIDNYIEMIRVGFTLDTHRVAILGLGEGVTNWTWTDPGGAPRMGNTFGNDFHQEVAHYDKGPNYTPHPNHRAAMEGWARWYLGKVVTLVNRLTQTIDVDGRPLIENTIIVLLGEVGNGRHDRESMVYTLIGGGGQGRIRRNRWINTPKFDPRNRNGHFWGSRDVNNNRHECAQNYGGPVSIHHAADLWVSIARLCGLNINTFGIDVYNHQPINLT